MEVKHLRGVKLSCNVKRKRELINFFWFVLEFLLLLKYEETENSVCNTIRQIQVMISIIQISFNLCASFNEIIISCVGIIVDAFSRSL
jgi:hypothetical protein